MQKKTAPLGEKRQNRTIGMVFLVLGFTAVSGGLMLLFTWSLLGLLGLLILGGSVLMSLGYLQMTGFYIAVCPQCKHTSLARTIVWRRTQKPDRKTYLKKENWILFIWKERIRFSLYVILDKVCKH